MIAELTGLISSFNTLRDLTASLQKMKTDDAVREKVAELNFSIIDMQNQVMRVQAVNNELSEAKTALEAKLVETEEWEDEKAKFALALLAKDVFVYRPVGTCGDITYSLCVHCFSNRRKSILQRSKQTQSGTFYDCPNCKNQVVDHQKLLIIKGPASYSMSSY